VFWGVSIGGFLALLGRRAAVVGPRRGSGGRETRTVDAMPNVNPQNERRTLTMEVSEALNKDGSMGNGTGRGTGPPFHTAMLSIISTWAGPREWKRARRRGDAWSLREILAGGAAVWRQDNLES
jgi:hypothetical protein